jgi:hypothetical protein
MYVQLLPETLVWQRCLEENLVIAFLKPPGKSAPQVTICCL